MLPTVFIHFGARKIGREIRRKRKPILFPPKITPLTAISEFRIVAQTHRYISG